MMMNHKAGETQVSWRGQVKKHRIEKKKVFIIVKL